MLAKRADILLDVAIDKSWFMIVKMVFVFVFVFVVVRARVLVKEDTEEEDARCWCTGRKALVVRKARSSIVNVDNSFVGFISILNFKIYGMDRLKSIRLYYFIMFDLPIIWLVGWFCLLAFVCVFQAVIALFGIRFRDGRRLFMRWRAAGAAAANTFY